MNSLELFILKLPSPLVLLYVGPTGMVYHFPVNGVSI